MTLALDEEHEFHRTRMTVLDNGIRVVTAEVDPVKFHPSRCRLAVDVLAGAAHEELLRHPASGNQPPYGAGHFVEHCGFSEEANTAFSEFFDSRGYQGKIKANAGTSGHWTIYSASHWNGTVVRTKDLLPALSLHLQQGINSDFSEKTVEHERARISSEIRRFEGDPAFVQGEVVRRARTPGYIPNNIPGNRSDIAAIKPEHLMEFHNRFYVGSNIVVPVLFPKSVKSSAHRLTHEIIVDQVQSGLGWLDRGSPAPVISNANMRNAEIRLRPHAAMDQGTALVDLYFPAAQAGTSEFASQLALVELSGSKLQDKLRLETTDYYFGGNIHGFGPDRIIRIGRLCAPENAGHFMASFSSNIRRYADGDFVDEFRRFKLAQKVDKELGSIKEDDVFGGLQQGMIEFGKPSAPDRAAVLMGRVTFEDVRQAARKMIHGK